MLKLIIVTIMFSTCKGLKKPLHVKKWCTQKGQSMRKEKHLHVKGFNYGK